MSRGRPRVYLVDLPDGVVARRSTVSKEYAFVVAAEHEPYLSAHERGPMQWAAFRWSETREAAWSYARSLERKSWIRAVRVLECRLQEPAEGRPSMPRTKKGAAPVAPEATTDGDDPFAALDTAFEGAPSANGPDVPAPADTVADKPKRGRSRKAAAPASAETPAPAPRRGRAPRQSRDGAFSEQQFRTHFPKATDVAVGLAMDLVAQVQASIPNLEVVPRQQFLGLKSGRQMVLSIIPTKAGLRLVLPLAPETHLGIAGTRDVSKVGHWGVGGLEWKVDGDTDSGQIVALVSEAVEVHAAA